MYSLANVDIYNLGMSLFLSNYICLINHLNEEFVLFISIVLVWRNLNAPS